VRRLVDDGLVAVREQRELDRESDLVKALAGP
jgi:hypothetical protein